MQNINSHEFPTSLILSGMTKREKVMISSILMVKRGSALHTEDFVPD
jgi:hypothetical protein